MAFSFLCLDFRALGPGVYRLREVPQNGWTQLSAEPADLTASSGADVAKIRFGNVQSASLSGLSVRLVATDPAGNPIAAGAVGDQFLLQVWLRDVTAHPQGVYAAFLDVVYDAAAAGFLQFCPTFVNAHSGTNDGGGLIDEAGAADDFAPRGGGEFVLF